MSEQGRYPEKEQREATLRLVHGWFQEQADYRPRLYASEILERMGIPTDAMQETEDVQRQGVQALYRFVRLVHEGYIDAKLDTAIKGGPPFSSAQVNGLTDKGLLEIGEVPDPRQQLVLGITAALHDIQNDPTLSQEEKEEKLSLGREALAFVRGLAVEVAAKVIVGGS